MNEKHHKTRNPLKQDGPGKLAQRQNYDGKPFPDQFHFAGHFVEPLPGKSKAMNSTTKTLLEDINLSELSFSDNGRTLTIEFINMFDGGPCAQLTAKGVVVCNYQNTFGHDDSALPAYVGEVTCQELREKEAASVLSGLGYGFLGSGGATYVSRLGYFHIHIESGELIVDLVCEEFKLFHQEGES